jgi:arginyl-tRNA synthetase
LIQVSHLLTRLVHEAIERAQAAGALPAFAIPADLRVTVSRREDQGDYAVALMPLAKLARGNPAQIAGIVAAHLPESPVVGSAEAVAPGYLNLRLSTPWLQEQVEAIIAEGENLFALTFGQGKRAQVEFVSANPTGPLTIGRSRGAVIGDSTARVLEAAGYTVEREYYFNNAGRQMENLGNSLRIRYLQAIGDPVETPTGADADQFYQGDYLIEFATDIAAERGDTMRDEPWTAFKAIAEQRMFEWIRATLARIDIHHDRFFNENSLYEDGSVWKTLDLLTERGHTYRAAQPENDAAAPEDDAAVAGGAVVAGARAQRAAAAATGEAVWFRSQAFGDSADRVLVKSSGNPTYTLPDIAYHQNKLDRGFDVLVNVLGADHYNQAQVVRYGLQALGYDPARLHVVLNQLVRTVRDGREVRMSTRRGVFDTLDALIDGTSPDAVRYILLARSPDSQITFDIDLAVRQSNDNPVYYIQYAHVRCAGIFREAALRGVHDDAADLSHLGEPELRFIKRVLELGDVLETAAENFEAYRIAFFALELANHFHPVFDAVRVLHSEVPPDVARARLRFYRAAQVAFARVLRLMGMSTPEHM